MVDETKIPIFIITFERLCWLKETVEAIQNQSSSYQIELFFIDNNSTYPPLITYLTEMEKTECTVVWCKSNHPFHNSKQFINEFLLKNNISPYFCVTDPDIRLLHPDCLNTYMKILDEENDVYCVGPALRTFDIEDSYALKNVVQWQRKKIMEKKKIQNKIKEFTDENGETIRYVDWTIDTTFAMYRSNKSYRRAVNQPGIRVLEPYEAQHLDWYIDSKNISDDQKNYIEKSSNNITHWSGKNNQQTKRFVLGKSNPKNRKRKRKQNPNQKPKSKNKI